MKELVLYTTCLNIGTEGKLLNEDKIIFLILSPIRNTSQFSSKSLMRTPLMSSDQESYLECILAHKVMTSFAFSNLII